MRARLQALTLVGLALGLSACARPTPPPDTTAVRDLVARWTAMWNGYDLDAVDELFLPDSTLTYFSSEREGLIRGIAAVREHHAGFSFASGGRETDTRLWLEQLGIDRFGDTAVVTAIWFFQRAGEETPQRGPVTALCVRRDTRWRIAHMNFSTYRDDTGG